MMHMIRPIVGTQNFLLNYIRKRNDKKRLLSAGCNTLGWDTLEAKAEKIMKDLNSKGGH